MEDKKVIEECEINEMVFDESVWEKRKRIFFEHLTVKRIFLIVMSLFFLIKNVYYSNTIDNTSNTQ